MNQLPQHKKSPEEIAKLRESLGVPSASEPGDFRHHGPAHAAHLPHRDEHRPNPVAGTHAVPPVHSRPPPEAAAHTTPVPVLAPESVEPHQAAAIPIDVPPHQRPMRSMKKTESLAPAAGSLPVVAPDSKLPVRRHSEEELAEARRRDALTVISHGPFVVPHAAHPAILVLGYVLAIGGAAAPTILAGVSQLVDSYAMSHSFSSGYHLLTGSTLAATPIAAFIGFRKSLSRHHAAFIATIIFFALVFALLHYFPQLRHAT